ncbi:MAG: S8 family serine peptidase [Bacteroidetes bacterium]|nr:S8 family serine peptidase [Bacteroidota bacterium]
MHPGRTTFGILLSAALLFPPGARTGAREHQSTAQRDPAAQLVPGVVVVALRDGVLPTGGVRLAENGAIMQAIRERGVRETRLLFRNTASILQNELARKASMPSAAQARLARIVECTIPLESDPLEVATQLSRLSFVEYAEPKYLHTLHDSPNDPQFTNQIAFTRMNAVTGWSLGKGDSSVLIATIDGGTYWRHEDLLPNVRINAQEDANGNRLFDPGDLNGVDEDGNGFADDVVGWNFTNSTPDPAGFTALPQSYAHGTATASHFGAVTSNGIGMAGSSWNCSLLPVCVASPTADNTIQYGYEGIAYAAARGAKVINCSWGRLGGYSRFEQDVITAVTDGGALVVVAAGNDNVNCDAVPHFPSNYRGVLSVGATGSTSDTRATFTNYGITVPVYAPGVDIVSAFVNGGYGNGGSGTSYSSPLVAGLAGILRTMHSGWTPAQVAAQIRMTADPIDLVNPSYAGLLGKGRVNFARALTEDHVGLDVTASDVRTPSGRRLFLPGDTILVTLTLRNTLFQDALNVAFSATSSSASVQVMETPGDIGLLTPGQSTQLAPFRFLVGEVTSAGTSVLRFHWTVNGTDADGTAISVRTFPVLPIWVMQLDGAEGALYSVHAVNSSVAWAAGGNSAASRPLVLRTTDGGESWFDQTGTLSSANLYCVNALDAQRAWAGTGDGRIVATSDGGSTWHEQTYPGRRSPFINGIRMFPDGTGYAQGDPPNDAQFVLLKTTDFGATWAHMTSEPTGTSGEAGWNNSFWWTDQTHGWFGTNHNKVWRTTNGGESWSSSATGASNSFGVAFRDASTGYAIHDNGFIAQSTNGGESWGSLASPTTSMISAVTVVPSSASAWAITASTPYHTRNDGGAWTPETLFPVIGSLKHLSFADTSTGWLVTSNGEILKYSASTPTGVGGNGSPVVPLSVRLDQNYPNPFNGSSRIRYRVLGSEPVALRLTIFDLLGREVDVLAQGMHAAGEYAVEFDARHRASGVYVYVLEAQPGDGGMPVRISQRMVLVR